MVEALELEKLLLPITSLLRTIMRTNPAPEIRTHDVVFAPVGSPNQKWHYDDNPDPAKPYRYYTILIHLNPLDKGCGGTEIWSEDMDRGDLIRARPGDALVFPGNLMHRGMANLGLTHRYFYFAAFSCHSDINEVML